MAKRLMLAAVWAVLLGSAPAAPGPTSTVPRIHPGAVEVGISIESVSVEGIPRTRAGARVGGFFHPGDALMGLEVEPSYTAMGSLDVLDLQASLAWQQPLGGGSEYVFLAVGGGVRQEWLGSFRQARYPVGIGAGFRVLFGNRAGARAEYRYRRVLDDPVADFSEHQTLVGLFLLFRNPPTSHGETGLPEERQRPLTDSPVENDP